MLSRHLQDSNLRPRRDCPKPNRWIADERRGNAMPLKRYAADNGNANMQRWTERWAEHWKERRKEPRDKRWAAR